MFLSSFFSLSSDAARVPVASDVPITDIASVSTRLAHAVTPAAYEITKCQVANGALVVAVTFRLGVPVVVNVVVVVDAVFIIVVTVNVARVTVGSIIASFAVAMVFVVVVAVAGRVVFVDAAIGCFAVAIGSVVVVVVVTVVVGVVGVVGDVSVVLVSFGFLLVLGVWLSADQCFGIGRARYVAVGAKTSPEGFVIQRLTVNAFL